MEYLQHQLNNGLTILAECNPHAHVSAMGYFVKAGARDEQPEFSGVSHFLEHMAFKGTPNRSADEVNLKLDQMGSSSNARTSEESTIYHAAMLPEFQSDMVELLSDIMRPSLREDDFQTEKQVIIEEIQMYADQPPYGGYEMIMAEFFGQHPLSRSVLGTVETVSSLTPEQMRSYFRQRYSPSNMALVAAGKIDFDCLVQSADSFCGDWEDLAEPRQTSPATTRTGFRTLPKPSSTQQYMMQLACGPATSDSDRFASRVAMSILGDDGGSRLYWQFVDPGRAESAGMGSYEYLDNGAILTFLCCAPERAQENLEILQEIQAEVAVEGVTQKELELAKRKISSRIVLASERTESRMFSVGGQWLAGQPFLTPSDVAERYESVTLDEVNTVLAKYPLTNNMTLAVGPNVELSL